MKFIKKIISAISSIYLISINTIYAYAAPALSPNVDPSSFTDFTLDNISANILGLTFFLLRLFGAAVAAFGIKSIAEARINNAGSEYAVGIGKLIIGVMVVAIPTILKKMNVIA